MLRVYEKHKQIDVLHDVYKIKIAIYPWMFGIHIINELKNATQKW